MILGKHINRYYLRYLPWILVGLAALIVIPVLRAKKKKAALLARLEQENPDAAAVLKR